uniref:Serpentine receptor class gamma n=1 Tax=Panagrellus redivivus TaxID=6233 RepID=A0A7E4WBR2_PANRE
MASHIPYLALSLYSISFCLNWIAVLRLGYVFFGSRIRACLKLSKVVKPEFSVHFRIYLTVVFIVSIINIIYASYFITQWSPANKYTFVWIYVFGFMAQSTTPTIPVTVFGLMIHRILTVRRQFDFFNDCILPKLTVIAVIFFVAFGVALFIPKYPTNGTLKACWAFFCVVGIEVTNLYIYLKLSFGLLNVISSICFYFLIRRQSHKFNTAKYKRANQLTVMTGIFECLFNFIPHAIDGFIFRLIGIEVTSYVGPYSTFLTSIDAFMVAHAYGKTTVNEAGTGVNVNVVKPACGVMLTA